MNSSVLYTIRISPAPSFSFMQDRTNVIIVVEPVGLVGNRKYADVAAAGLKAVGTAFERDGAGRAGFRQIDRSARMGKCVSREPSP